MQKKWTTINSYVISNINQSALKQKKTTNQTNERTIEIQKPKAHGFLIRIFSLSPALSFTTSSSLRLPSSNVQSHTDFYNNNAYMDCEQHLPSSKSEWESGDKWKKKTCFMDFCNNSKQRVLQSSIARQQMLFINHELVSKQYAFTIAIVVVVITAFHIVSKFECFWSFDLGT